MNQKIYEAADKRIIWTWDDKESNAANMVSDNLEIQDSEGRTIWNMRDVLGCEDTCVAVGVMNDTDIRFITWNGWCVILNVADMNVISKQIVK